MATSSPLGVDALVHRDLLISEGAENRWAFHYGTKTGDTTTWVDLTEWTARMQIRARIGGDVWWDAEDGDEITLTNDGWVYVDLSHVVTEDDVWWSPARKNGVWDLELIDGDGNVKRLAMGAVIISKNVTRADGKTET